MKLDAVFVAAGFVLATMPVVAFAGPIERALGDTPSCRRIRMAGRPNYGCSPVAPITQKGRGGDDSSGRWNVNGNRLRLSQRRPLPAPLHFAPQFPCSSIAPAMHAR
jgi:hypothetical protein